MSSVEASAGGTLAQFASPVYCQKAHAVSSTLISSARSTVPIVCSKVQPSAAAAAAMRSASAARRGPSASRSSAVSAARHSGVPTCSKNSV